MILESNCNCNRLHWHVIGPRSAIGLGGDVFLRVFLFLALAATLFSRVEQFEQCFSKEHFCEIILKSANWPWRRCRFMSFLFLALVAILFSRAEPF